MATYTPFIERNVDKMAGAIQQKQTGDLSSSAYMGDEQALQQLYGVNPQLAERIQMKKQQEAQNKLAQAGQQQKAMQEKQKAVMGIAKQAITMPFEQAQAFAAEQAQALGIDAPPLTQEHYDQFKKVFGGEKGNNIGEFSPKDFTSESLAKYAKTGNIEDVVRYSPQVKEIAGIPHQVNPATQKWEPIVDLSDPGITNQVRELSKIEADKQSELDFGKAKTKWESGETQTLNAISMADSKTKLLSDTTDKLKKLLSDRISKYGTGVLSNFPATDERTIKNLLQTIKANSAFTTLTDLKAAGGTLGTISEAELGLLSSALGTADQAGDAEELIRVLDQITKANDDSVLRLKSGYDREKSRYSKGYQSSLGGQEAAGGGQPEKIGPPPGYAERRAKILGGG